MRKPKYGPIYLDDARSHVLASCEYSSASTRLTNWQTHLLCMVLLFSLKFVHVDSKNPKWMLTNALICSSHVVSAHAADVIVGRFVEPLIEGNSPSVDHLQHCVCVIVVDKIGSISAIDKFALYKSFGNRSVRKFRFDFRLFSVIYVHHWLGTLTYRRCRHTDCHPSFLQSHIAFGSLEIREYREPRNKMDLLNDRNQLFNDSSLLSRHSLDRRWLALCLRLWRKIYFHRNQWISKESNSSQIWYHLPMRTKTEDTFGHR